VDPKAKERFKYIYSQPYRVDSDMVIRDAINKNVYSDQFFKPKKVKDWTD
jgi:hypothetical protein